VNKEIMEKLKKLKPILKDKFGIEEFAVFGSVARGEDTQESDIDIAVLKARKKNYFDLLEAKYFISEYLNKKVDIGYYDSIRNVFKRHINKDLINV
jgi:predicted nucleotidyltransferase